jgi:threonine/homoserine/homoserine lactone efflux protein
VTSAQIAAYAVALLLAVASPGPAVLVVLSTGLARGRAPAVVTGIAISLSDVVLVTLAMLGLAALASAYAAAFILLKYAGAAYLVWLGIRMWRARPDLADVGTTDRGLVGAFGSGVAVALGNPKAILFHASLMPLIIDLRAIGPGDAIVIAALVLAVNLAVLTLYALAAARSRRWLTTPRRLRAISRGGGAAMVGVGALVATR